jgi:hypothetical protein
MYFRNALTLGLIATLIAVPVQAFGQDVRVTVVTIMANDREKFVDAKLNDFAREVQKHEPTLTCYRLGNTTSKEINLGQKEAIELVAGKASADVKLLRKDDSKKRVTIEVKPPLVGAITYETCYDKFFPIVTRAVVDGERLIIAVMVKPVGDKAVKPAP